MTLRRCTDLDPQVAALLALAMWPDPARIRAALGRYATDPELQVWAWMQGARPVCAAGLRVRAGEAQAGEAELLHLGTLPDMRGQGHARRLLLGLTAGLNLSRLQAETDDDSAGFYRRAGFEVRETQARGGHSRYCCTLTAVPPI